MWWTALSSPSFLSPSWKQQDKHIESLHLQNFIREKLIEYTFSSLPLSFSSLYSFFFFLFLTFGNEWKCTGNLLTALFTLALVREKIWVFDHLVLMFSNKINIFVCKKREKPLCLGKSMERVLHLECDINKKLYQRILRSPSLV